MTSSEELIRRARDSIGSSGAAAQRPTRRLAVVTCMDARVDPWRILGAGPGEIHAIRNAGGVVTADVLRSLVISQRRLGTMAVDVIMHTGCGMLGLDEDALRAEIAADTGEAPRGSLGGFADLEGAVHAGVTAIASAAALPHRDAVEGFIYDVATGQLRRVT